LILYQDHAARFRHARGFPDELRHIVEVVRRDAARDEVKGGIVEGQAFGGGELEFDVGDAFAYGSLLTAF